jgi:hypothetical protein
MGDTEGEFSAENQRSISFNSRSSADFIGDFNDRANVSILTRFRHLVGTGAAHCGGDDCHG